MARDTRAAFLAELDRVSPMLREAFERAFQDIRSATQLTALEAAIERGDLRAAVAAVELGEEFFAPLDRALDDAFYSGGVYQMSRLPKPKSTGSLPRLVVRFQGRNPRAERWARDRSSSLITGIVTDQRIAIREAVAAGLEAGRNPRSVALDIVGRMEGNQRKGGIVGLSSVQAGYVQSARAELSDPELMYRYFTRQRRDRRFDRTVYRARREGRGLTATEMKRVTGRYADRLLALRGETIARTEALTALSAGRYEALEQLVESGKLERSQIKLRWSATGDARTRDAHWGLDRQEVRFGEPFQSPTGALMLHPGDTSMGAGGEDVINCRCFAQPKINYLARAGGNVQPSL